MIHSDSSSLLYSALFAVLFGGLYLVVVIAVAFLLIKYGVAAGIRLAKQREAASGASAVVGQPPR